MSSPNSPIQLPRMVEKIVFLLASSISVKDRKLKWRVRRWVMGFRPPPGGPMAQAKLMSTICLKVPVEKEQGANEIFHISEETVTINILNIKKQSRAMYCSIKTQH